MRTYSEPGTYTLEDDQPFNIDGSYITILGSPETVIKMAPQTFEPVMKITGDELVLEGITFDIDYRHLGYLDNDCDAKYVAIEVSRSSNLTVRGCRIILRYCSKGGIDPETQPVCPTTDDAVQRLPDFTGMKCTVCDTLCFDRNLTDVRQTLIDGTEVRQVGQFSDGSHRLYVNGIPIVTPSFASVEEI